MNTITLNGTSSTTVTGLLIQELPPITRPKMRTQQTTIDGRAGDIITDLGYDAYDRETSVGLHGAFDIDSVIAFFSGKGEAVFSNEPDKVYDYEFLEKVDYNRLLRFRTAKVKMHVQPYKHKYNETPEVKNLSGASGTFTITNAGNFYANPVIDIVGSGTVTLEVEDGLLTHSFSVDMSNDGEVIVDTEKLETYYGNALKNRLVTGNIGNFKLNPGANTINWSGAITRLSFTRFSRWI